MNKWVRAQETTQEQRQNQETLATKIRVDNLISQLETDRGPVLKLFDRIWTNLEALKTHPEYDSSANLTTIKEFERFLNVLQGFIAGGSDTTPSLKRLPELPPATGEAETYYKNIQSLLDQLKNDLPGIFNTMKTIQQLLVSAQDKDWVKQEPYPTLNRSYTNAMQTAKDLGLTPNISPEPQATNISASIKHAYPQTFEWRPHPKPVDLKKWSTLAKQIDVFRRAYKQYTFPQVLYHFTKDWNMFDRYKFKRWYRWTRAGATNKMEKRAQQDYVAQDRLQQFQKKKKLLMSRIGLVRKALHDLIHNNLISKDKSGKIYKILSMLEYEALSVESPQITAARLRRSGKQLTKLGFSEGAGILSRTAEALTSKPSGFVKTAQEGNDAPVDVEQIRTTLSKIKDAMDKLNYSKHLDTLFYIKKDLEEMGRDGDAEAILKVIRDDLAATDKLNKKLTEIYTNLSRVPMELSETEDKKMQDKGERKKEMPMEVTEEESEKPQAPTQRQPRQQPRQPREQQQRQKPQVETEIPNV